MSLNLSRQICRKMKATIKFIYERCIPVLHLIVCANRMIAKGQSPQSFNYELVVQPMKLMIVSISKYFSSPIHIIIVGVKLAIGRMLKSALCVQGKWLNPIYQVEHGKTNLRRGIKFKREASVDAGIAPSKHISIATFCKTITNRQRGQLNFAIRNHSLILDPSSMRSQNFILDSSSVSLAKLLEDTKLSGKMKLLLSYYLAKAVWQFYDSEWMRREWTKETVQFMFERRSMHPRGIYINEPFLNTHFDGLRENQGVNDDFRTHPFPKVLALGIMFLEIELGIKIEDYRQPEDIETNGEPTVNADHIAAMGLFNSDSLWEERETFGAFREVIGACLIPDDFNTALSDVQSLRNVLKRKVVQPLQALFMAAWGHPDSSQIRPLELETSETAELAFHEKTHPASASNLPMTILTHQPLCPSPLPQLPAWTYHPALFHGMQ